MFLCIWCHVSMGQYSEAAFGSFGGERWDRGILNKIKQLSGILLIASFSILSTTLFSITAFLTYSILNVYHFSQTTIPRKLNNMMLYSPVTLFPCTKNSKVSADHIDLCFDVHNLGNSVCFWSHSYTQQLHTHVLPYYLCLLIWGWKTCGPPYVLDYISHCLWLA